MEQMTLKQIRINGVTLYNAKVMVIDTDYIQVSVTIDEDLAFDLMMMLFNSKIPFSRMDNRFHIMTTGSNFMVLEY